MNLRELLPRLAALAVEWAEEVSSKAAAAGEALDAQGVRIAREVGVSLPGRVRIVEPEPMPFPEHPMLRAAALQTGTFAGIPTAVQVNYGTDPLVNGYGIRFDRVTVTNAEWQVDDGQSDSCTDTMPFFGDFEEGDFSEWSSTVP